MWVVGELGGGEEVLPGQFFGGVGVFLGQGVGQVNFAEALGEVFLVNDADGFDLQAQGVAQAFGKGGNAVVLAFSITDDDLVVAEVDVFDAQAQAFHQAQARAIEQLGHEPGNAVHAVEDGAGFLGGEDGGQGFGFFGAKDVGGDFDGGFENVAVEKEDSAEGLVLGGGGDVLFDGEVGEELLDFLESHISGVAFVVKEDVAFYPFAVGLFGAVGVVFDADGFGDLVEEFFVFAG